MKKKRLLRSNDLLRPKYLLNEINRAKHGRIPSKKDNF